MIAFILTILKTAGLILLAVLCLILTALLLILLVPVRYRLSAVFPETTDSGFACGKKSTLKEEACASGLLRVTWLASLVCFQARFRSGDGLRNDQACLKARLTVLGIPLWPRRKRKAATEKNRKMYSEKQEPDRENTERSQNTESEERMAGLETYRKTAVPPRTSEDTQTEIQHEPHTPEFPPPDPLPSHNVTSKADERIGKADGPQEAASVFTRIAAAIRSLCERLKNLFADSAHAAAALGEKIEKLVQTWNYYQELYHSADTRKAVDKILGHAKKLFRHILPQRFSASLTLGTGDPASTANLLALHGMFYPLVGEAVHITPDFDRACLAGKLSARGRVRLCVPIYHLLVVILDKRTWRLIRQLKKEEVANGR